MFLLGAKASGAFLVGSFAALLAAMSYFSFGGRESTIQLKSFGLLPSRLSYKPSKPFTSPANRRKTRSESLGHISVESGTAPSPTDATNSSIAGNSTASVTTMPSMTALEEVRSFLVNGSLGPIPSVAPSSNTISPNSSSNAEGNWSLASIGSQTFEGSFWDIDIRKFGFCGECAHGQLVQVQKNKFIGGGGFDRLFINILDPTNLNVKKLVWDMADNNEVSGKYHKLCDDLRQIDFDSSGKDEQKNDDVVEKIRECVPAPELCDCEAKEFFFAQKKGKGEKAMLSQKCLRKFKDLKKKIKEKEDSQVGEMNRHHAKDFAIGQRFPSMIFALALLLSLK